MDKDQLQKCIIFIGYRGLINQAMTCYLNSLIQVLYMTPEFRNVVYQLKFDFYGNIDESKSILFQLQKLFLNLQVSMLSISCHVMCILNIYVGTHSFHIDFIPA